MYILWAPLWLDALHLRQKSLVQNQLVGEIFQKLPSVHPAVNGYTALFKAGEDGDGGEEAWLSNSHFYWKNIASKFCQVCAAPSLPPIGSICCFLSL